MMSCYKHTHIGESGINCSTYGGNLVYHINKQEVRIASTHCIYRFS